LLCRRHLRVQILTRGSKNFRRCIFLDPAVQFGLVRTAIDRLGVKLLASPARFHHIPAIGCRIRIVDDERRRSTLPGRFLIFIGPAAIIGHRPATKITLQAFGTEIGIVHQYDDGLALHIDAGIVVPAPLGRVDAIANKHQFAVGNFNFRLFPIAGGDIIAAMFKGQVGLAPGNFQRGDIFRGDADQRNILKPVVPVTRLQPGCSKFFG